MDQMKNSHSNLEYQCNGITDFLIQYNNHSYFINTYNDLEMKNLMIHDFDRTYLEILSEDSISILSRIINPYEYEVYSDGAYTSVGHCMGIAFVVVLNNKIIYEYSKSIKGGTSQVAELTAAIYGLRSIKFPSKVTLTSDSQYLIGTMNDGWKRNCNQRLWNYLDGLNIKHQITWKWVRGHSDNEFNNRCDYLAHKCSLIK